MLEKRKLVIDDEEYVLNIFIERRNSSRASITNNSINIRVPRQISTINREKEIEKLLEWVRQKIHLTSLSKERKKLYRDGDYLRTNSKIYRIKIENRDSINNFSKYKLGYIIFKISNKRDEKSKQKYISKQLQKILAKNHNEELNVLVNKLNGLYLNQELRGAEYKYTKSRWGVCKIDKRKIEISTKLLLAPIAVLEYVIIHELCHLIEPSHNKRFWQIVKSIDPNFKQKKKWLKINGNELHI